MFSTGGGGVGSSTDVKVSSFFTAGESGVTTTVNGGASGLGIIHASYNGVSSGGIEKFNTRIDKGSNVAIQAYITQKQWILMAFNDLLRIAWRGDWRRAPLWAGNALDPTNNVDIAAGLGSSTAYLLFDFDRTARMYLRRFRRSAEGYFFHCDSVQYFYKKTGSGAYELTSRPHMTNDGLVWIDGNRWQLGHYNLANPLIYFQSAPVCLLNSPADGATTGTKPVLQFTGTDQDGDDITYEVQISNNNTFIDTPDKISGLKAWWKADSLGLTDGTAVSSWGDSSASGIALTQATSANQPIFKTNIINGQPVVRFDGSNDRLRAASTLGLSQPNTIFIVVGNWNSSTAGNLVDVATGDGARQLVAYDTGVALGFYAGTGFVSDAPATHPGYICISALFNGASSTINVNGTQVLTGNPGSNGLGQPTIGSDGGNAFGGDIAEIIVFNRALTALERAHVENYLGNKYGIQTSGTDAPFFDKFSATDAGFLNTVSGGDLDPFTQNNQISFTVQVADALAAGTYYWRARGKDPNGSGSWGGWSATRSIAVSAGASCTATDAPHTAESMNEVGIWQRTATDALTIAESLNEVALWNRTCTDAPHTAESAAGVKTINRTATDALTTSELAKQTNPKRTATDALTTSESLNEVGLWKRTTTDAPTTAESIATVKGLTRSTTDAPTTAEVASRSLLVGRSLTDAPTTADAVQRLLSALRTCSDALSTSEVASRSIVTGGVAVNRTATDALTTAEVASRVFVGVRNTADSPQTAEVASKSATHPRTATDALTTAESATRIQSLLRAATDGLTTAETIARQVIIGRTTSESLTTAEVASRTVQLLRSSADNPGLFESATAVRTPLSLTRFATDAPTTSESATAVRTPRSQSLTATDALTTAETISRQLIVSRSTSESLSIAMTANRTWVGTRIATEALATSELATANRNGLVLTRTASDALTVSESLVRVWVGARTTTDAPTIAESVVRAAPKSRTSTDALTTAEVASRSASFNRTTSESLTTSEVATSFKQGQIIRSAADSLTIAESVTRIGAFSRSLTDHPFTSESAAGSKSKFATTTESLSVAMTIATVRVFVRSVTDAPVTAESVTRIGAFSRSLTDHPFTSESAQAGFAGIARFGSDALSVSVTASWTKGYARSVSDALLTSENAIRTAAFLRFVLDHPFTSEVASASLKDVWDYYLDLDTGNDPTQSNWECQHADSGELVTDQAGTGLAIDSGEAGIEYVFDSGNHIVVTATETLGTN